MVPVAVEDKVKFNLVPPLAPRENVFPASTEKLLVTVTVLPALPAAAAKMQLPLTVRLDSVMIGTAVMARDRSFVMITASPSTGAPLGLQLPATVQSPPFVDPQVLTAPLAVTAMPAKPQASKKSGSSLCSVPSRRIKGRPVSFCVWFDF